MELRVGLERILQNDQESLFVSVERDYLALSTRAEELIVKLIVGEVSSELKGYLGL